MRENDQKKKNAPVIPNEKLKQERLRRQLTHEDLAELLEIADPRTISRWERGLVTPSLHSRQRLCKVFGKSEEELGLLPTLPPFPDDSKRDKNRQRLIARVRTFWITGLLEQSLHGAALIALGLQAQADAVADPWHLVLQLPDQPARRLPAGTRITRVYDDAAHELLILGAPGSGKTTLLLELARDLLASAEADDAHPIPVIFNLSSWAVRRLAFADWLVEELNSKYQVPRELGQAWVDSDQVLLLLDGLDEVSETHRQACVQAINAYHQEHALVPLVVCSRFDEYFAQATRVTLNAAVMVQSLSPQQIETYLTSAGSQLKGLRAEMAADPTLQKLAVTPLMLSILSLTYSGKSLEKIRAEGTTASRKQIFEHYVQCMLQRQSSTEHYTPQETMHWLAWLARQMKQQNQTVFYIEQLQFHWLSGDRAQRAYDWLGVRLPGIFIGALVGLAVIGFLSFADLSFSIVSIVIGGLLGELWSEGSVTQKSVIIDGKARSKLWPRILVWLGTGALLGLILDVLIQLDIRPQIRSSGFPLYGFNYQVVAVSGWLCVLFVYGLWNVLLRLLYGQGSQEEHSRPALATTWQRLALYISSPGVSNGLVTALLLVSLLGTASMLVYGLTLSLVLGSAVGLVVGLALGLFTGLASGLLVGPCSGLLSALLMGKDPTVQPVDQLSWSWGNLGMTLLSKRHIRPTAVVGLTFGLIAMVIALFLQALVGGPTFRLVYLESGLILGLIGGLSSALAYWLLLGFWQGVSGTTIEDRRRVVPNQGIRRSAYNGLALGLVSALIVGLTALLRQWLVSNLAAAQSAGQLARLFSGVITDNLTAWLRSGLLAGICAGLVAGLLNGGLACLRHYVLRFLLWRAGSVPWRYAQFLDYASGCILLRKVGGGYIFIHRLLLEYFASL